MVQNRIIVSRWTSSPGACHYNFDTRLSVSDTCVDKLTPLLLPVAAWLVSATPPWPPKSWRKTSRQLSRLLRPKSGWWVSTDVFPFLHFDGFRVHNRNWQHFWNLSFFCLFVLLYLSCCCTGYKNVPALNTSKKQCSDWAVFITKTKKQKWMLCWSGACSANLRHLVVKNGMTRSSLTKTFKLSLWILL